MNHIYQSIQGWFNYETVYDKIIPSLPENFNFAEIGVWKGKGLSYFTVSCINQNKSGNIYAIDHWLGSEEHRDKNSIHYDPCTQVEDGLYKTFLQNISSIQDHIIIMRKNSLEAAASFEDNFFDAIFIDASHEYEDVAKDLIAWFPKVKTNGIISGHDYDWPGVKRAVDEFLSSKPYELSVFTTSWYFTKGE